MSFVVVSCSLILETPVDVVSFNFMAHYIFSLIVIKTLKICVRSVYYAGLVYLEAGLLFLFLGFLDNLWVLPRFVINGTLNTNLEIRYYSSVNHRLHGCVP